MTARRCSFIGGNGLRCRQMTYRDDLELCFRHSEMARKDRERLPSYGGGPLSKSEKRRASRTTTDTTATEAGLSVESVTRTEPSDGYIEWDDDEHIDPLDRIEDMAREYKRTRWGG